MPELLSEIIPELISEFYCHESGVIEFNDLIGQIKELESMVNPISIDDSLPELGLNVLVHEDDKSVVIGHRAGKNWINSSNNRIILNVTHWMKIPKVKK